MNLTRDLIKKAIDNRDGDMLHQVLTIQFPEKKCSNCLIMEYDGDVPRLFGERRSIEMLIPKDMDVYVENAVVDAIESGSLFDDKEDIDNKVKYISMTHLPHLGMMHKHIDEPHAMHHAIGMVVGAMNPDGHFGSSDTDMKNGSNYTMDLTKHGDEKDTSVMDLTADYLDIKDKEGKGVPKELRHSLAKVPEEIKEIKEVKAEDTVDENDYEEIGLDHETDEEEPDDEPMDEESEDEEDDDTEEDEEDSEEDAGDENGIMGAYIGSKVAKKVVKKGAKYAAKKAAKKVVKKGAKKVKQYYDDKKQSNEEDDDNDHDKDSDKEKSIEKFLKGRKKDIDIDIEDVDDQDVGFAKESESSYEPTVVHGRGAGTTAGAGGTTPPMMPSQKSSFETNNKILSSANDAMPSKASTASSKSSYPNPPSPKKDPPQVKNEYMQRYREYDEEEYYQEFGAMLAKPKKLKPIPREVVAYIVTQKNAIRDANDQSMIAGYCCSKLELVDFYLNCLDTHDYRYIVPHNRQYLVQMQNDLNRCLQEILRMRPVNRTDRMWQVGVNYPEGWRG